MTSTTLSKNSFKQGWSIFLWTLKSSKATIIVYLSILAFTCISCFMTNSGLVGLSNMADSDFREVNEELLKLPIISQMYDTLALSLLFAFILSIQGFGYLHNKRKTDMFGALPVSRRTMFFSKMISVIAISSIPFLIVMIALNIICAGNGLAEICSFQDTINMFVCIVANVSLFGLLSVCCGKTSDTIISSVVINCAYPVSMLLIQFVPASLVFGYVPNINTDLIFALSPITSFASLSCIYWIVFSAVCIAGCFFLVKRRKAEAAQSHFAYKLPAVAVKVIISFAVGIVFAYFFSLLFGNEATVFEGYMYFWIGMILGSLVAYIVIQIILAHGVSGFFKGLIPYGAMIGVFAVVFIVLATGMLGYESYVPNADEIKSVSVLYNEPLKIDGKIVADLSSEDKEFIEDTIKAHKNLVEYNNDNPLSIFSMSANNLRSALQRLIGADYIDESSFRVKYILKNGSVVERDYGYQYDYTNRSYFESKSYLINTNLLFLADDKYACALDIENYSDDYSDEIGDYYECELTRKSQKDSKIMNELMEAIRKDYIEGKAIEYDDDISLTFYYCSLKEYNNNGYFAPHQQRIYVNDTYENTMKVLKNNSKYLESIGS